MYQSYHDDVVMLVYVDEKLKVMHEDLQLHQDQVLRHDVEDWGWM
jgi:hypothetical protein